MNWRTINTETRSFWKKMIFQKRWTPWDVTLLMLFPLTPFCIFESNISGFPQLFCRTDIFSNCTSVHPCPTVMRLLLPGERNVSPWHFLQVVDRGRFASEAVVGVVVCHDGGGPQLTELAVWTLQLQLNGLQLCVFTPIHWWHENKRAVLFHYWDIDIIIILIKNK